MTLLTVTLVVYLTSSLGYMLSLGLKRVQAAKVATVILSLAVLLHGTALFSGWVRSGQHPLTHLSAALSLMAWLLCASYLIFQLKTKTRVLGSIVAPAATVLLILALSGRSQPAMLPAELVGWLVPLHVFFSVAGEALFTLAAFAGAMYLVQDRWIKRRRIHALSRLFPPLRDLDRINQCGILWGFPLMTVGILAGAVWAGNVWGSHWPWDAKQVWTLAAWVLYALVLHQRLAIGWKGHKAAVLTVNCFALLLLSFLFVILSLETRHHFF